MPQLWKMPRTLLMILPMVAFSNSLRLDGPKHSIPPPTSQTIVYGRRSFVSSAAATIVATATMASNPPKAQAKMFPWQKEEKTCTYQTFKSMLASNEVLAVEFGNDGTSLSCVDNNGEGYVLKDIPDDPPLLKQLYKKEVLVTLQEMKFQKKMNTVNWFRDLAGFGDDITEEEMYAYRGYKTNRMNIPERSYVPSNLITGLDLSRNMRK